MDVDSNIILHTETTDKRQVDLHSPNMERKVFIKSMDFLLPTIRCSEVITDASSSIRKTLGICRTQIHGTDYFTQRPGTLLYFIHWMCGTNLRSYGKHWQR